MPVPSVAAAVDDLAEGLARRIRDAALAEDRLAGFAFTDDVRDPARRPGALAGDARALDALARDLTLRALAAAAGNYAVLAALGDEPVPTAALARGLDLPALAVTERIGALAQLGLAARDVERDAAVGTPAGRGVVALVDGLAAAVARRGRQALAELA
jgi:hypothetical protein